MTSIAAGLTGCGLHGTLLAGSRSGTGVVTTGVGTTSTHPGAAAGTTTRSSGVVSGPSTAAVVTSPTSSTGTPTTGTTLTSPLPGAGKPTIELGDENTSEQFVLGELYKIALADQGFSVALTENIGTSAIWQQDMASGTLDLFPVYLNQWDTEVAGDTETFTARGAALAAGQSYAAAHGMELLDPTPFSDTYGLAVSTAFAEANGLRSLADLSRLPPPLVLGAPPQFSATGGGLSAIEQAYAFVPSSVTRIEIGSQYSQLAAGTLQAAWVYTTDWELGGRGFKLLSDPKHVLGFGNVVPVTTNAVVAAEGPDFVATIDRVSALLTTRRIRWLNYLVADLGQNPEDVASSFLVNHGIVPLPS
jgi:osmoprotectant transport system substrate-binding protein